MKQKSGGQRDGETKDKLGGRREEKGRMVKSRTRIGKVRAERIRMMEKAEMKGESEERKREDRTKDKGVNWL